MLVTKETILDPWEATPMFRWMRVETPSAYLLILQQRWFHKNELRYEWRDIPTVDENGKEIQ